jgi:putative transcriptional regulator
VPTFEGIRVLSNVRVRAALFFVVLFAAAGTAALAAPEGGSLAGQLLVATPEMPDPRFAGTVIYMVRHDSAGALGLALNRPIGTVPLAQLLERLGLESEGVSGNIRVHSGGPVDGGRGFVLHTAEYSRNGTVKVNEMVAVTFQPEVLRDIAAGAGPRRALFALGYAGWAPGQLEAEIKAGGWVGVPADEALVFDEDYEGKWRRAMARRMINL